jgi:hypothetical protein
MFMTAESIHLGDDLVQRYDAIRFHTDSTGRPFTLLLLDRLPGDDPLQKLFPREDLLDVGTSRALVLGPALVNNILGGYSAARSYPVEQAMSTTRAWRARQLAAHADDQRRYRDQEHRRELEQLRGRVEGLRAKLRLAERELAELEIRGA